MKILITGAAGFIGSHLVDELHLHGHDVHGIDHRPAPLIDPGDLLTPGVFADCLDRHQPDLVVHLAAQVGRLFGEDDIRHTVRSNTEMTAVVAAECGRRGIRLAYASTSEVYGDRGDRVCRETDPLNVLPHNAYGLTKRQGEEFCQLYTEDPILFRFSMPYGPGVPPGRGRRALDTMLWQAHHRLPITVHRGAERSWCWIGDTVNGIVRVLESGEGGAWNVGRDDRPFTMLSLAHLACELAGADARNLIEVVDPPARQTVVKRLSTEKLRDLGWEPAVELAEGIVRVHEWVRHFDRSGNYTPQQAAS
jgi:nucleoside-diphosphate-sugar epimerase